MNTWWDQWTAFDDAVYLDSAAEGPLPTASARAVQRAVEAKTFPHRVVNDYFGVPNRLRASLARLVGGSADEIALTTGASAGAAIVAHGIRWTAGDEVLTGAGEFPLQYSTWAPLVERDGVTLRVAQARGPFLTADDLIGALTPRTRLVSVSLVRFDDGSLLDAAAVAVACRAQGALLCLDVSQCCGAMPIDVAALGADFLTCAGYKWLVSPYGTGFFWARLEHLETLRAGPFYWMATAGMENFSTLGDVAPKPAPSARRWDTPEWAGAFNPNLAGMVASATLVEQMGPATVYQHNGRLIDRLFTRLPRDLVDVASPIDAGARGPFGCFRARDLAVTHALHAALADRRIIVSLREGNIRVSPHLFNSEADIDTLVDAVAEAIGS